MGQIAFRSCGAGDADELLQVARAALATDSFYPLVFGFDDSDFEIYWRAYFDMVLGDPSAMIMAAEHDGSIVACGALGYGEFPTADGRSIFRERLQCSLLPTRWEVFRRFLDAYDDLIRVDGEDSSRTAQVLWLLVHPGYRKLGLLTQMMVAWMDAHRPDAIRVLKGLVNADAPGLRHSEPPPVPRTV